MPARDAFHALVRSVLEREGWTVTHDPYHIDLGFRRLYLAIPSEIHRRFFKYPFIQTVIQRNQIPLIIYTTATQEGLQWIH
ncbi:MAG: element excision factor XisH family protein [Cyanobacteria bacterium P01_F01_bin.150]